jgi:hypothetical protein
VESVESTPSNTPNKPLVDSAIPSLRDQHLRITVSMPSKTCEVACSCQCHVRSQFQTPRWLQSVIGLLFYTTSQTPKVDIRPCDSDTCCRSLPSSSTQLVYYFPTWIMRSVLFVSTFHTLEGINSSWTVKMPREVPRNQSSWHNIQAGNTGTIRDLLYKGQMSPYDVDTNGISMLHVCFHHAYIIIVLS